MYNRSTNAVLEAVKGQFVSWRKLLEGCTEFWSCKCQMD